MKIEHTAYQVEDPVAVARWYVQHLGMSVKRAAGRTAVRAVPRRRRRHRDAGVLQQPEGRRPRLRGIDPLILHIAFWTDDVAATRTRLLAAGASAEGEALVTPAGDHVAMLRDPWGMAIQFVHRSSPML